MDEPTCSVSDDKHSKPGKLTRGMCLMHYTRWLKYGDPLIKRKRWEIEHPEECFWVKVNKDGPLPEKRPELGACWVWTAATQGSGYGVFRDHGAHRVAYEFAVGQIPDGLELDHLCHPGDGSCRRATCRHRLCVNPEHLEPVTRLENIRRSSSIFAANMAKTHCPQGHEYTPENTRIRIGRFGTENRSCKECGREQRRVGKSPGWHNAAKTHCPQGHEYSPENTRFSPEGWRICIACRGPGKTRQNGT